MSMEKFEWHHRESKPRTSDLWRSVSTNWVTACPRMYAYDCRNVCLYNVIKKNKKLQSNSSSVCRFKFFIFEFRCDFTTALSRIWVLLVDKTLWMTNIAGTWHVNGNLPRQTVLTTWPARTPADNGGDKRDQLLKSTLQILDASIGQLEFQSSGF